MTYPGPGGYSVPQGNPQPQQPAYPQSPAGPVQQPYAPYQPPPAGSPYQQPVQPAGPQQQPPPQQPVQPAGPPPQQSPQGAPTSGVPVSPGPQIPAQQTGTSPQAQQTSPGNDYVLGIDLGTSHTVAVVRWPDGRSRPLLVDGAPVMPSAVFLDESGHIHVGRDAQRLAQTDPTRYEPNPKHRIGEDTVLLGDREISTTGLLAGILREIASKAVEAVGKLPPTVLTCPAKWGPNRRAMLEDAAAQAGFPPVKLVPEPVAAAHYFAEVMKQPIPEGKSVAVFDFGGGTLDIAVVKHESDGSFVVQADGGLADLGGLDVDAALVQHLGRTIDANAPQIWQQLSQPTNANDRRNRRLFWDDVRGAKEMLSRTTVAPLPVPSVEASLHVTREELERLATPLLQRAVEETQRVIGITGQAPDQLAGLFLVGGASRIPLVGRMLHSALGIAPSVLEQPELPVAEGSLAAAFPLTPTNPAPQTATQPMSGPTEDFLSQEPPTPWYKRKSSWIAAAALLLIVALGLAFLLYDPYPQHDMEALEEVGEPVDYPGGEDSADTIHDPKIRDDVAYYPVSNGDGEMVVTAVDMATGEEEWSTDSMRSGDNDWAGVQHRNNMMYAVAEESMGDTSELTFIDLENGDVGDTVSISSYDSERQIVGDSVVVFDYDANTVTSYDNTGSEEWSTEPDIDMTSGGRTESWADYYQPNGYVQDSVDNRLWVRDDKGHVEILDRDDNGKKLGGARVGSEGFRVMAYEGQLFVSDGGASPNLSVFDMDDLSSDETIRVRDVGTSDDFDQFQVCGETRMCMWGDNDDDGDADRITAIEVSGSEPSMVWQSDEKETVTSASIVGETLALRQVKGEDSSQLHLYDSGFDPIADPVDTGRFKQIDSGSLLNYPTGDSSSADTHTFEGLGARDGTVYQLGSKSVYDQCIANATYLSCATEAGYQSWIFRP